MKASSPSLEFCLWARKDRHPIVPARAPTQPNNCYSIHTKRVMRGRFIRGIISLLFYSGICHFPRFYNCPPISNFLHWIYVAKFWVRFLVD